MATTDITLKLAEILVGISKDNRPEMAEHHSRLDEFKALLRDCSTDSSLDVVFSDDLYTAWNEMLEMKPEDVDQLKLEIES